MGRRRFWATLSAITLGGLVFRVLYVLLVTRHEDKKLYDAFYYQLQAYVLSRGHFFPVLFGSGPDAAHPPLTSILLTPATYLFGLNPGETPQRLTMALIGGGVILLVGLLGRLVAGPGVGLVASGLAAVYPNMWMPSGIVMSESLSMLLLALVLLASYRLMTTPNRINAGLLGLACGAEMLVRAELVLLVPLLLVPAALVCRRDSWVRRLVLLAVALLVAGLTIGPWVGRNLVSFRDTTALSTGEGPVLLGANCPQTYDGPDLGSWSLSCSLAVRPDSEQSIESTRQYDAAKTFIAHHLSRVPLVVLARVGRVWDLYEPLQMVDVDVNEGRPAPASFAGLLAYYAMLPAAVVGAIALRLRRITLWPMLVPAAAVTIIAATGYGLVRFRAEFEVPLVVLAATGYAAVWRSAVRGVSGRAR